MQFTYWAYRTCVSMILLSFLSLLHLSFQCLLGRGASGRWLEPPTKELLSGLVSAQESIAASGGVVSVWKCWWELGKMQGGILKERRLNTNRESIASAGQHWEGFPIMGVTLVCVWHIIIWTGDLSAFKDERCLIFAFPQGTFVS